MGNVSGLCKNASVIWLGIHGHGLSVWIQDSASKMHLKTM